jgi:hypothetical protein
MGFIKQLPKLANILVLIIKMLLNKKILVTIWSLNFWSVFGLKLKTFIFFLMYNNNGKNVLLITYFNEALIVLLVTVIIDGLLTHQKCKSDCF